MPRGESKGLFFRKVPYIIKKGKKKKKEDEPYLMRELKSTSSNFIRLHLVTKAYSSN